MAQFQSVIAPLTKNNAVIFFFLFLHIQIQLANWEASHVTDMLRIRSAYLLFIWLHVFLLAAWIPCEATRALCVRLISYLLQGTMLSVTVSRLLMLAYFSLIKLFMPDTASTLGHFLLVSRAWILIQQKAIRLTVTLTVTVTVTSSVTVTYTAAVKEIQLNEKRKLPVEFLSPLNSTGIWFALNGIGSQFTPKLQQLSTIFFALRN